MTMSKKDVTLYMTGGEDMAVIGKFDFVKQKETFYSLFFPKNVAIKQNY